MNTKKEIKEDIISKEVKVGSRANLLEKRAFSKESQRSQTLAQHNEIANKRQRQTRFDTRAIGEIGTKLETIVQAKPSKAAENTKRQKYIDPGKDQ